MSTPIGNAFESIESAHDFVTLLTETVVEAKRDVEADVNYFYCGVPSARRLADRLEAYGIPCGKDATTLCYDCGISLCSRHAVRCHRCLKTFCQSCLTLHQTEHTKPINSDQVMQFSEEKTA